MKKFLSLFMLVLVVAFVIGCTPKPTTSQTSGSTSGTGSSSDSTGSSDTQPQEEATYTYNLFIAGMPNTFNVHTWESNDDYLVPTYAESPLYDFILNEAKDGYDTTPEMAGGEPIDVTTTYAGNETYGIPEDAEEGYAFKIPLNEDAVWANGVAINADTYMYSMGQLLAPEMQNYRADSWYTGTLVLANAEEYYKQGQTTPVTVGKYMELYDLETFADAVAHATAAEATTHINYIFSYGADDAPVDDPIDEVVPTDLTLEELWQQYLGIYSSWGVSEADTIDYALEELYVEYTFPDLSFENVGFKKTGEYEITLILKKPITDFYLKYNLSSCFLVYEDLYEDGKTTVGELVQTDYGTSVETYMSYGPYKLTEFQDDKVIKFTKNDNWYGYTDGRHVGQFQTTDIQVDIVAEHNTALMMFLKGQLDEIGLVTADVPEFKFSENLLYAPETYTSKLTINSDPAKLLEREDAKGENIDKEIFANIKFREAMSWMIDRQNFVQTQTAGSAATLGLLNNLYISNVETGEVYRNTDVFRNVVLKGIYGTTTPTGYDVAKAKQLLTEAYNEQLTAGKIDADDIIELEFSIYKMDNAYTDKVVFLQKAFDAATVGTPLEGRIRMAMRVDEDYYESSEKGDFDMIWSTWGGNPMDPFSFMSVYTVSSQRNEYGFRPATQSFSVEIDGVTVTKTYNDWYYALNEGEYNAFNEDYETRLLILASFEYNFIKQYVGIPVYSRTTVALFSDKINYATNEYVPLVAFGGIRGMTYNYTDAEWAEYIKEDIDYTD